MRRFVVYHEDEWTGGEIVDQVIHAESYEQAKERTNKLLAPEYMSPYQLKQQD